MVNEAAVVDEDNGDGNIQCVDHPYKTSSPGGICAFCLQEKLGKLVSSSFPIAVFPSSSSSTSPSFRSAVAGALASVNASSAALPVRTLPNPSAETTPNHCSKRSRLAFLVTQKKKKNKDLINPGGSDQKNVIFKRSKSTATPRHDLHFPAGESYGALKRGFWPFLYTTKHSSMSYRSREKKREEFITVVEDNESPNRRKVSRSRSVGCGSRRFSGDFFERISTGFGDCTLRRVESQREGKPKSRCSGGGVSRQDTIIKESVKCSGLFSGFMITSSSSSSSSSSNYISSSTEDNVTGKAGQPSPPEAASAPSSYTRSKNWGWALPSPIRAFRPSSKIKSAQNKKSTPNLAAVPSLLAIRS